MNEKGEQSSLAKKENYIPKLEFKEDEGNDKAFKLKWPEASPVQGWLVFASSNESYKSEDLTKTVSQIIAKIEEDIDYKINQINAKINGMGERDKVQLNPAILMVFSEIEDQIKGDKDVINKLTGQNYQFFVTGYTTLNTNNLAEPLYKKVLFITDLEFVFLLEELKKFELKSSTGSDGREQLQTVFRQVLETYLGGKEAKKVIKTISLGQVMGYITGSNSSSTLLSKWKIEDLTNEKALNNSDFNQIIDYISNQKQKLDKVKETEKKKYRYEEDDKEYYWVPAEFMP